MRTLAFAALALTVIVQSSPQTPVSALPQESLRVGGSIQQPVKVKNVPPRYPVEALKVGIEGVVVIDATVDTDGRVSRTEVLSGPTALRAEAVSAVEQWVFEPTLMEGRPVSVVFKATLNFTLVGDDIYYSLEDLLAGLRNDDEEIREAAAVTLGRVPLNHLLNTMGENVKPVRAGPARKQIIPALREATADKSERVRKAATEALARFQSQ